MDFKGQGITAGKLTCIQDVVPVLQIDFHPRQVHDPEIIPVHVEHNQRFPRQGIIWIDDVPNLDNGNILSGNRFDGWIGSGIAGKDGTGWNQQVSNHQMVEIVRIIDPYDHISLVILEVSVDAASRRIGSPECGGRKQAHRHDGQQQHHARPKVKTRSADFRVGHNGPDLLDACVASHPL